jgi:TATA-binding protein-associated factor Taf7
LDKDNKEITQQIASYLSEPRFSIRMAALFALGARGDATAVPALEALLKSDDLSIEMAPMIKAQIARLKSPKGKQNAHAEAAGGDEDDDEPADSNPSDESSRANSQTAVVAERLDKLEHLLEEMNDRLKSMETRLPPKH